eukprot:5307536-Pyramimonas_sp.AAC.2
MGARSVVTVSIESTIPPADHMAVATSDLPLEPATLGLATSRAAAVSRAHSSYADARILQIICFLGVSAAAPDPVALVGILAGAPSSIALVSPLVGGVE